MPDDDPFPGPLVNPDDDWANTEPDGGTPDGYEALRQMLDAVPAPTFWDDPTWDDPTWDDPAWDDPTPDPEPAEETPTWFRPDPADVDPARLDAIAARLRAPD